jgi:aminoglycoside 2''-phosphotransferase
MCGAASTFNEHIAAGAIDNQVMEFIGEGWNAACYLVNGTVVFRLPKRAEVWPEIHREVAFLAAAADRLPLTVPRYVTVAPQSPVGPHGHAAYHYVPGVALDIEKLNPAERDAAAEAIAGFLKVLHGLTLPDDVAAMLPREDAREAASQYLTGAESEVLPLLPRAEAETFRREFGDYLATPGFFSFTPVVLHADLSRQHLLVTEGRVTGAIDFGDVNWGDADYDFMYLAMECGWPFAESIARRYGHGNLEQLAAKVRIYELMDHVDTMIHGTGIALEGQQHAAWQRLRRLLNPAGTL